MGTVPVGSTPRRALSSGTVVTMVRPRFSNRPFVAAEEEQVVGAERAAQRAARLVAAECRLLVDVEVVAGVEGVVAVEQEAGAGEPVGAGLGDDVDLAAGGAAVLGAVAVRGEAELADRLHPQRRAGGAAGRAVGEVVLQRAVEQVDVGARVLAIDAHRQAVRHHRAVVAVRERVDRRQQLHQVGVVAAVDRNLLDGPLVGQVAELAGLRVHPRRAAHRDFLGGADLQRERHRGALADGETQARSAPAAGSRRATRAARTRRRTARRR